MNNYSKISFIIAISIITILLTSCGGVSKNETRVKVDKIEISGTASEYLKALPDEYVIKFEKEGAKVIVEIQFEVIKELTPDKVYDEFSLALLDGTGNIIDLNKNSFVNRYSLKSVNTAKIGEKKNIEFCLTAKEKTGDGVDYDLVNRIMENSKGFNIKKANVIANKDYVPEKKKIYALEGKKVFGSVGNCLELVDTVVEEGFINIRSKGYQPGSFVVTDPIKIAAIRKNNTNRCFPKIEFYDKNKKRINELLSLENGGDIYDILGNGEGINEITFSEPLNSNYVKDYQKHMHRIYYFKVSAN